MKGGKGEIKQSKENKLKQQKPHKGGERRRKGRKRGEKDGKGSDRERMEEAMRIDQARQREETEREPMRAESAAPKPEPAHGQMKKTMELDITIQQEQVSSSCSDQLI
jgi:hypothetical protein